MHTLKAICAKSGDGVHNEGRVLKLAAVLSATHDGVNYTLTISNPSLIRLPGFAGGTYTSTGSSTVYYSLFVKPATKRNRKKRINNVGKPKRD